MGHMRLDQMARRERAAKAQLAREDAGGHDASELLGIVTGIGGMSASNAEEVEHCTLRLEDGAAANGADFDGGHGDADLEIAVIAGKSVTIIYRSNRQLTCA